MILISHRGNLNGRITDQENNPEIIRYCIINGFDVEIDVRLFNDEWWLGHDEPQFKISIDWLIKYSNKLWLHCKNIDSLNECFKFKNNLHYFWHEHDAYTLTSKNIIWAYPGSKITMNSVCVLPENNSYDKSDLINAYGICSDNIRSYLEALS